MIIQSKFIDNSYKMTFQILKHRFNIIKNVRPVKLKWHFFNKKNKT